MILIGFIFQNRTINHAKGSHGISGIFYKYDLNSLKIRVREQHQPIWQFLVRLCGIIGGVFSVAGNIYIIVTASVYLLVQNI